MRTVRRGPGVLRRKAASNIAPRAVIAIDAGSGTAVCAISISGMLKEAVPLPPLLLKIVAVRNGVVEMRPANTNVLVSYVALPVLASPTGVVIPNVPEFAFTLKKTPTA